MASGTVRPADTKMPTQQVVVVTKTAVDYRKSLNVAAPPAIPQSGPGAGGS